MTPGRQHSDWLRLGLALIVGVACCVVSRSATARPDGIWSAEFFPDPQIGCKNCHGPARGCALAPPDPLVRIECSGVTCFTTLAPNVDIPMTFVITPQSGDTRSSGGLNVRVAGATLNVTDTTLKTDVVPWGSELTHTQPRPKSGSSIRFDFKLKTLACGTSATVTAWGNLVNMTGSFCGDAPATTGLTINTTKCANGTPCTTNSQCASGLCLNQVCAPAGQGAGASCSANQQCASSNCLDNFCCGQSSCPGPTAAQQC